MEFKKFIEATICTFDQPAFDLIKALLIGDYIPFYFIKPEDVTVNILAEKTGDYFHKLEIKTGKSFDRRIDTYMKDLDTIVAPSIAKTVQSKVGETTINEEPRSRKYYEKAVSFKSVKTPSVAELIDYTRIMMCLYTEIINNPERPIINFDYASSCLIPEKLVDAILGKNGFKPIPRSSKKFSTRDPYGSDRCTGILLIILLCTIINTRIDGDQEYE